MRAHYHNFKEQQFTNYKSTYNKEFVPKASDYTGKLKHEAPKDAIVFGNHRGPMLTTHDAEYTRKEGEVTQNKTPLQQSSSLVLGDKGQTMETMNQLYYNEKPIVKNELP
jgi:hypothetical protein